MFDKEMIDFMVVQRASRIEARLRLALTEKVGLDLSEVRAGLGFEGYKDILSSQGVVLFIERIPNLGFDKEIDLYSIQHNGKIVDQFTVDFFGVISDYEELGS